MSLPKHLAIIMDGNGRWAQGRRRPRSYGHVKGTRVAKKIITECSRLGLESLTLYAFSTENWFRPETEVRFLMSLLRRYLKRETANLIRENIRFSIIGETGRLPEDLRGSIEQAIEATSRCTGLHLVFALSYGSRQEITDTCRRLAAKAAAGEIRPEDIDEALFDSELWTGGAPGPDLVIRTSGEQRLSNFLLWQTAYSELHFTKVLWPDFTVEDLNLALSDFAGRERRFGKLESTDEELRH